MSTASGALSCRPSPRGGTRHTNQDREVRHRTQSAIPSPHETSIPSATATVLLPAREHGSRLIAASAAHSSSVVPVASDATASSGALASLRRPRSARSKLMEEKMRVLTINELMRMTRKELCGLAAHISRPAFDLPRRIGGPHRGTHQPAQHSLGSGPAGACARLSSRLLCQDRRVAQRSGYRCDMLTNRSTAAGLQQRNVSRLVAPKRSEGGRLSANLRERIVTDRPRPDISLAGSLSRQ